MGRDGLPGCAALQTAFESDKHEIVRIEAVSALLRLGSMAYLPRLGLLTEAMVSDKSDNVRASIASGFQSCLSNASPACATAVSDACADGARLDSSERVRAECLKTLGSLGDVALSHAQLIFKIHQDAKDDA